MEFARQDLVDGYYLYQKQADGIGTYFLESIVSDIDSLIDHAGISGQRTELSRQQKTHIRCTVPISPTEGSKTFGG